MSAELPAVPWADLMDEAEATYWDAENVHGTDAGIRALAEWAYRKGIESVRADAEREWDKQEQAAHVLAEEPY